LLLLRGGGVAKSFMYSATVSALETPIITSRVRDRRHIDDAWAYINRAAGVKRLFWGREACFLRPSLSFFIHLFSRLSVIISFLLYLVPSFRLNSFLRSVFLFSFLSYFLPFYHSFLIFLLPFFVPSIFHFSSPSYFLSFFLSSDPLFHFSFVMSASHSYFPSYSVSFFLPVLTSF
jgi:hypothetical protein